MKARSLSSHLTRLRLVFGLLIAGTHGLLAPPALARDAWPIERLPPTGSHNNPAFSRGTSYTLSQDLVIDGTPLAKGRQVVGIPEQPHSNVPPSSPNTRWILPPLYEELSGMGTLIFGKRFGQARWVRIDLSGSKPQESPSPYSVVRRIPRDAMQRDSIGRGDQWVGVDASSGQVVFLDPQGAALFTVDGLRTPQEPRSSITVMRGGAAFVVSHADSDRIYAADGTPRSPAIPRVSKLFLFESNLAANTFSGQSVVAVKLDPERPLYWPISNDGSILPKPDDLIGLEPMKIDYGSYHHLVGWRVWWDTPEGERCARVATQGGVVDLRALMASRAQADYTEIEVVRQGEYQLNDIRRRAGQERYEIHRWDQIQHPERFASLAEAREWLTAKVAAESAATQKAWAEFQRASAEGQKQWQAAQAARLAQAAKAKADAEQAARKAQGLDTGSGFDRAMSQGNRLMARSALLALPYDAARWTQYIKTYGLDPAGNNSSQAVSYARAMAGGADLTELHLALKRAPIPLIKPDATPPQKEMSDWEYFWHGKPTGVFRFDGASPSSTTDNLRSRLRATEQQNFDAWMRGAQSWGAKKL